VDVLYLHQFDPDTLTERLSLRAPSGPIRTLPKYPHLVGNDSLYRRVDRTLERVGHWPVAVSLSSGKLVGARRFTHGVAIVDGDAIHEVPDAPVIRTLAVAHGAGSALGVSEDGRVLRIHDDGTVDDLGLQGVTLVADGSMGMMVARDTEVAKVGAWRADVGDEVTALATGGGWFIAGTRGGQVLGFDADGALAWHLDAHPEQISGLAVWNGEALFTSSWAPGVRRWWLPPVSP